MRLGDASWFEEIKICHTKELSIRAVHFEGVFMRTCSCFWFLS